MTSLRPDISLDDLIVCPTCDAVYSLDVPEEGDRAVCARCNTVLITNRRNAAFRVIALSLTVVILIIASAVFPFLRIDAVGLNNSVSILDAAFAFSEGLLSLLALVTAALIFAIPLCRAMLTIYVLAPIALQLSPRKHAKQAFRLSEALRPWSMAEIFAIGCAVALIKVADLAEVSFGPAFWMFSVLVVLVVATDNFMCRWSIWKALDTS